MVTVHYGYQPVQYADVVVKVQVQRCITSRDRPMKFIFVSSPIWVGIGININRFWFYNFLKAPRFYCISEMAFFAQLRTKPFQ
jgi:hypothetical protein